MSRREWLFVAAIIAALLWWVEGPFVVQQKCTDGEGDELLHVRDANGNLVQLGTIGSETPYFCTLPDETALGVGTDSDSYSDVVYHPVTRQRISVRVWPDYDGQFYHILHGYSWECPAWRRG